MMRDQGRILIVERRPLLSASFTHSISFLTLLLFSPFYMRLQSADRPAGSRTDDGGPSPLGSIGGLDDDAGVPGGGK
jgi:hypothetical protein